MSQITEKDAAASDTKRLLSARWYLLGQPWCHSSRAGTAILAGSEDPHAGTFVADTECLVDYDNPDMQNARSVAQHIVDLHNASLEEGS